MALVGVVSVVHQAHLDLALSAWVITAAMARAVAVLVEVVVQEP
jgi:hypothetical protein